MAKVKKEIQAVEDQPVLEATLKKVEQEKLPIEDMPLNTLRDYRLYNEEARKMNKKLRLCRYPIKQCPIELHPKQRVVFRSNDQPHNPQKVHLSNDLIHFDETLIPGKTYDLPECVVHHLATRENPEWGWFDNPDGSRETRVKSKRPRFSLTHVYQD
jgi:hypothetical protein